MNGNLPLGLLLTAGAAFTAVWLILMQRRLMISWYAAILIAVLHTLYGVFTVKAFAFMETGFDSGSLGSMSLFGGVFFMPQAYFFGAKFFRRDAKEVFDLFTPCMIATVMCARVNCILSGCCQGQRIPGLTGARFPTRELEIVLYILLLLWLCPRTARGDTHGQGYPFYMICYGGFRFLVEFFREAGTNTLFHRGHLWALLTFLLGISIYAEINTNKSNAKRRKKT